MKNKFIYKDKEIKKWSIISFFIIVIITGINLLPPLIMKRTIDEYIPSKDYKNIIFGIILFVSIPFINILLQTIFNYLTIKFARNKGNEISIEITKNLMDQEITFFDTNNSIELLTYASKEAVQYVNFYVSILPKYYASIIILIFIYAIIFSISWKLAIIQILFIPLAFYPVNKISDSISENIEVAISSNAKIAQIRADIFKGIELIKAYRLEHQKLDEVKKENLKIVSIWGKVAAFDSLTGIWVSGFLKALFAGLTFGVGAYIISSSSGESLSIGSLIQIIGLVSYLYATVDEVFRSRIDLAKENAEFKEMLSYLDLKGESSENDSREFKFEDTISINNLSFSYKDRKVLNNLSFEIKKGHWTALVGESGAGKTTIIDLLLKFYDYDDGKILVDGVDLSEISRFSIRDEITKVSQDLFFFPGSIRDNLMIVRKDLRDEDIKEAIRLSCLDNFIEKLENGLDTDIGEAGKMISGGEKNRLAFARALLRGKSVYLLDELTANLDKKTENILKENIKRLVSEKNITVLSISHNMNFLEYCDSVYELKDGKALKIK